MSCGMPMMKHYDTSAVSTRLAACAAAIVRALAATGSSSKSTPYVDLPAATWITTGKLGEATRGKVVGERKEGELGTR